MLLFYNSISEFALKPREYMVSFHHTSYPLTKVKQTVVYMYLCAVVYMYLCEVDISIDFCLSRFDFIWIAFSCAVIY
jgi:hypothetical protein